MEQTKFNKPNQNQALETAAAVTHLDLVEVPLVEHLEGLFGALGLVPQWDLNQKGIELIPLCQPCPPNVTSTLYGPVWIGVLP